MKHLRGFFLHDKLDTYSLHVILLVCKNIGWSCTFIPREQSLGCIFETHCLFVGLLMTDISSYVHHFVSVFVYRHPITHLLY